MSAFIIISVVENAPLRSPALGRMRGIIQSLISDLALSPSCCDSFSHGKRPFDDFWHCRISIVLGCFFFVVVVVFGGEHCVLGRHIVYWK